MQKTTEKLNVYNKPHNENSHTDELIEKTKEILYLKGVIKKFEIEKKELIEKNNELLLMIQNDKRNLKDIDSDIEKAVKNARILIAKAKEINRIGGELANTIGDKNMFITMIKTGNAIDPLIKTLKFALCLLNLPAGHSKSAKHSREQSERRQEIDKNLKIDINSLIEDDISNLLKESNILGSQINKQKLRVHDLFRRIETSVEKSRNYIGNIDSSDYSNYTISPQLSLIKTEDF
ncbi:hypothetical protein SteCoe_18502 [Stentor coeruleus]|uniref:Uncharacterized protein n=1 Tax=Stentor coeruleus TaxID=5963 RepID=A0A1R2BWL3_9CILI|nr:hypothetical protein SteCoe_18502 [Stentor coeruleus]